MSRIKECISTRYIGDIYVSLDYKQLEIVGKALLTNDPAMKQDIRDGKDFHCIRASMILDEPYQVVFNEVNKGNERYVKARKEAKTFTFRREYGAMPKTIAKGLGWDVKRVEKLIEEENTRYFVAHTYFENLMKEVNDNSKPTQEVDPLGNQIYTSQVEGLLGKLYTFRTYWNKWKKRMEYSRPQILNWPVQGFSTGDLTQIANGCILDVLELDKMMPILYTYDSVDFEMRREDADRLIDKVAVAMTKGVKDVLRRDFNFNVDVPLRVDAESGSNKNSLKFYKQYGG